MLDQLVPSVLSDSSEGLDSLQIKRVLETALLTTQEPLSIVELKRLFENQFGTSQLNQYLEEMQAQWSTSGIELVNIAGGWRFQSKMEMQEFLDRLSPQKPPRYSRAVLETLAIIAYRQPVTRGDIEDIRGVTVSGGILKTLIARAWIDEIGHRDVPGRPALFATTKQFLNDLNLRSLGELPPLEELGSLIESEEVDSDDESTETSETPAVSG